jgi:hypothetical protein
MLARAVAGLLVLVLIGPSVVAATCELTCAIARHHAMGRHHHDTPSSSEGSCHGHQSSTDGVDVSVSAKPATLCHESGDLPAAVVDAWLNAVVVSAVPAAVVVIAPPVVSQRIARLHERRTPFDPRPTHRPLRV